MCTFLLQMARCGMWDWCIVRFVQQVYSAAVLWASFPIDSSTKIGVLLTKNSAIFQFQGDLFIIAGESSKLYIPVYFLI